MLVAPRSNNIVINICFIFKSLFFILILANPGGINWKEKILYRHIIETVILLADKFGEILIVNGITIVVLKALKHQCQASANDLAIEFARREIRQRIVDVELLAELNSVFVILALP